MAYMNPYMMNYQQQNYPATPSPSYSVNNGINWVSGEAGAKSWMVGRGETALLMDSENQCFYIKSADASGMPLPLRVFDYTERAQNTPQGANTALNPTSDNFITREEFNALRAKYEELEKQIKKPIPAKKKEVEVNE